MPHEKSVAAHLPYLRRFARALTGSQAGGDAYVAATLEAMIADPNGVNLGTDPKVGLYGLLLGVWDSIALNHETGAPLPLSSDEVGASRRLEVITPRPRVAFLLSAVEGFNTDEIARTLKCTVEEAHQFLDAAGREIADQMRTDVLIIEDEPLIALDIESLVEELGHRVLKVARTHREALMAVREFKPGLILADIQLADGSSGLEAANEILRTYEVPVIFVTAYPERFLTGAPPEPTYLITKPFKVDTLKAIISQALFFDRKAHPKEQMAARG